MGILGCVFLIGGLGLIFLMTHHRDLGEPELLLVEFDVESNSKLFLVLSAVMYSIWLFVLSLKDNQSERTQQY